MSYYIYNNETSTGIVLDGDFMYKKQYERSITMQQLVREELKKEIPDYSWTNK